MNVLEIQSLTKWYGSSRGIEDLTFHIEEGEIFGYLGPNGSGKTTTLRCILGLIKPTSGEARIFGTKVQHGLATQHQKIGYLPGDFRIWLDLTARKALKHLGAINGNSAYIRQGQLLAERLGLNLDRRIRDLSKGNRQKVGIILAFQGEPDFLILDEPTSGLDPLVRQIVLQMILEAAAKGATVLLSSHDLPEIAATCQRAAILRDGKLVALAPVTELIQQSEYQLKVWFEEIVPKFPPDFESVQVIQQQDRFLHLAFQGSADPILKWLAQYRVERISTPEPTLEEAFMIYYQEGENKNSKSGGSSHA